MVAKRNRGLLFQGLAQNQSESVVGPEFEPWEHDSRKNPLNYYVELCFTERNFAELSKENQKEKA